MRYRVFVMPRRILRSAAHAMRGLLFALREERNLRLFLLGFILTILLGFLLKISSLQWVFLFFAGVLFMSTELLNTAIEKLADSVDEHCKREHGSHCFPILRHVKDIAAAASLLMLLLTVVLLLTIFLPPAIEGFRQSS